MLLFVVGLSVGHRALLDETAFGLGSHLRPGHLLIVSDLSHGLLLDIVHQLLLLSLQLVDLFLLIKFSLAVLYLLDVLHGRQDLVLFVETVGEVVLEPVLLHDLLDQRPQVPVVRSVFESDVGTVLQVQLELVGQPTTQHFEGGGEFLLFNLLVLLITVSACLVLPRERAFEHVDHYVA